MYLERIIIRPVFLLF